MTFLPQSKRIVDLIVLASLVMIVSAFLVGGYMLYPNLSHPASAHPVIAGGYCC